jgi:hypothetical protein
MYMLWHAVPLLKFKPSTSQREIGHVLIWINLCSWELGAAWKVTDAFVV